jgi:hypothetical protein
VRERTVGLIVVAKGRGMAGLIYTRYGQASKTEPGRFGVLFQQRFPFCCSLSTEGRRLVSSVFARPHIPLGWMALSRELNKNK